MWFIEDYVIESKENRFPMGRKIPSIWRTAPKAP